MNIFLVYGGKSAEHDVSILSAYSILKEIYYNYYTVTPVYITREGKWLKGNEITDPSQVNSSQELILRKILGKVFIFLIFQKKIRLYFLYCMDQTEKMVRFKGC